MYGAAPKHETVTILPLDDPRNPFRSDYAPWDKWVYQHAVTCLDPKIQQYYLGSGSAGNTMLDAYVDQAGHLVPQVLAEERRLHSYAAGDTVSYYDADWTHVLYAVGPIDSALLSNYEQAVLGLRVEYSLPLPQWLAANPPAWAMILPPEAGKHAGEVITLGAPGADQDYHMPPNAARPGARVKVWRRYSPDGKLLATSKPDQEWWEFYAANPATASGREATSFYKVFEDDGIVAVTDLRTNQLAWMMTFDGIRLDARSADKPRNHNYWLGFTASEAKTLYALQHGQRLVKPASTPAPARPRPTAPPLGGGH